MNDKILVAYTTAAGSTGEVAEIIGRELSKEIETDVVRAKDVTDLSPYRAVVVGSGIRAGNIYKDTLAFLGSHQDALSEMPVAYFVVCLTMQTAGFGEKANGERASKAPSRSSRLL